MLEAAIGADYAGVLVSDFYAAYTTYEGRHQYCWAHLLRDVDDLAAQHRGGRACGAGPMAVHALYRRAKALRTDARSGGAPPAAAGVRSGAGRAVRAVPVATSAAPQRVLCERITKHLAELFVFVEDPAVPPTNNAAERSLRHLVTARKISGGTRSPAGTATKMTLATLFGTWRAQGLDPLAQCRALLANPKPEQLRFVGPVLPGPDVPPSHMYAGKTCRVRTRCI